MKPIRTALMACAGALMASGAASQSLPDPDESAQGDVSVTIYNSNLALVQDVRQLEVIFLIGLVEIV